MRGGLAPCTITSRHATRPAPAARYSHAHHRPNLGVHTVTPLPRHMPHRIRTTLLALASLILVSACGGSNEPTEVVVTPPPVSIAPSTASLPIVSITTGSGADIVSKDVYVAGTMTLTDTLGATAMQGAIEIWGRGNTTWFMPKKPYRLRLVASTSLLGMPTCRHWVLLAATVPGSGVQGPLHGAMERAEGRWCARLVAEDGVRATELPQHRPAAELRGVADPRQLGLAESRGRGHV